MPSPGRVSSRCGPSRCVHRGYRACGLAISVVEVTHTSVCAFGLPAKGLTHRPVCSRVGPGLARASQSPDRVDGKRDPQRLARRPGTSRPAREEGERRAHEPRAPAPKPIVIARPWRTGRSRAPRARRQSAGSERLAPAQERTRSPCWRGHMKSMTVLDDEHT
jgi:hypothetical protein